jgi:microfibrillar-associated protein 1
MPALIIPTGYYTQLIKLYKTLGLQFQETDFSYSFSSLSQWNEGRSITTDLIYNGASGRAGVAKPTAFVYSADHNLQGVERQPPRYFARQAQNYLQFSVFIFQYALCFLITLYHSLPFRRPSYLEDIIFRDWVDLVAPRSYLAQLSGMDAAWQSYVQMVLVPIFSAICTAPAVDVMNHPMEEFLGEFHTV